MERNMEEKFSVKWKIFRMEWKKIASMEYGKIVFHSMPCPTSCSFTLLLRMTLQSSAMGITIHSNATGGHKEQDYPFYVNYHTAFF